MRASLTLKSASGAALAALAALWLSAGAGRAAEFSDPDWPCIQRKVPHLSVGQMWAGPPLDAEAVKAMASGPDRSGLAQAIAIRRTSLEEADVMIGRYADGLDDAVRAERLTELFARAFRQIERERSAVIEGIARYARKQAELSRRIEAEQDELAALKAAEKPDLDRIEELEDAILWDTRIFKDRAQALSHVCETPVILERRAFAIGRSIAARLE